MANHSLNPTAPVTGVAYARCGHPAAATDAYCPACGDALSPGEPAAVAAGHAPAVNGHQPGERPAGPPRRRIGGTVWYPSAVEDGAEPDTGGKETAAASSPLAVALPAARSRHRHRRPWYRRPLLVVPATLLLVVVAVVGVVGYRAETTIATLHRVSTPPPVVADNTQGDDPLPAGVAVDSAPAVAVVRAAQAATGGTPPAAGSQAPAAHPTPAGGGSSNDGNLLGRVKDAARNVSDLAEGAAVAAGVKDPSAHALTLLVMGVDAGAGAPIDVGVRPDALMVVRLDPAARTCRLLAVPRDTRADLPGYGPSKINHALMIGGIPYQKLVVERLLGLPIDGYVLVDFVAFRQLVDAVGGVPVDVAQDVAIDGVTVTAGRHTMNGAQALAYARHRDPATDGDIGRVKRQWAVLRGLAEVEGGRNLVGDVDALLPVVADHVRTNLAAADLAAIATTYGGSCTADTVGTAMLAGTRVRMDDPILQQAVDYNVVDATLIRERVAELLGGKAS